MDKSFRDDMLQKINPDAQAQSILLKSLTREYTLDEIAILTRAGPARSLGLQDRGHLGVGAVGDITVYRDDADREAMFATPEYVFKNGELVVKNGKVVKVVQGATHVVRPDYDNVDREAAQRLFRPLPHGAHGQFQARRRGDHRRRQGRHRRAADKGARRLGSPRRKSFCRSLGTPEATSSLRHEAELTGDHHMRDIRGDLKDRAEATRA